MLKAVYSDVIVKVRYEQLSEIIVIPETAKKYSAPFYGEVVSIGPDYPHKTQLNIGDRVAFPRHEGIPIRFHEEEYMRLKEQWVNVVIPDTARNMGD